MEKEQQNFGTVYDDVFRTMIDKMPHLIIPLVNEVFSKHYPDTEPVIALQNEHMKLINNKVITDSYLKISDSYYHIECQSHPDGTMAIRMIEYDFLIAVKHAERDGYEYTINYPNSCVLYLRHTSVTPEFLTIHVRFPSGSVIDYHTPIIKVKQYDFKKIFEKRLLFFLPYYIMRYEESLPDIEKDDTKLRQLLDEYGQIYNNLCNMRNNHTISNYDFTELKELIETIMEHVAAKEERIQKGVKDMGGKVLEFEHDVLIRETAEKSEAKLLTNNIETIMKNLNIPLEKACELLDTTVDDYQKAKLLIS